MRVTQCLKALARSLIVGIAVFGAIRSTAQAHEDGCEWLEWGFGYSKVRIQDEIATYQLRASGPSWQNQPYGWHAPGVLTCKECAAHGLYHFVTHEQLREHPQLQHPKTAAERAARPIEFFGYPYEGFGPMELTHVLSRESIEVGPLKGYAVQFFVNPRDGEPVQNQLMTLSLFDKCIIFETVIKARVDMSGRSVLDSLLSELSIVKKTSRLPDAVESSDQSVTVRPRASGEKKRYLYEERPNIR